MKIALLFWTIALLLFLGACTDSDQYLFETELEPLEIRVYMTNSFDSGASQFKNDTIYPGDSLFFISKVTPSKSLRSQAYYWTIDGEPLANEYSFKNTVNIPGHHQIAFVYVDYFGDTLTDSLDLSVGTPPILDSLYFIPANETQQLDPAAPLNFAWNVQDPDSLWDISFHFVLQELPYGNNSERKVLVDTILHQSTFTYNKGFSPLKKYLWEVKAFNELKQYSEENIHGHFYVTGFDNKGAILGQVSSESRIGGSPYQIILQEKDSTVISLTVDSSFTLTPVASGKYKLYVSSYLYKDYETDSLDVTLSEGTVFDIGNILLGDYIPPVIRSITNRDTLDPLDTLKFLLQDGGGKIANVWVRLDGNPLTEYSLNNDTLFVPAPFLATSWSYKILSVIATDNSENRSSKTFYITPKITLPGGTHE